MKPVLRSCLLIIFLTGLFINYSLGQQKVVPAEKSEPATSNRDFLKFLARFELGLGYGQQKIDDYAYTGLAVPMDLCLGIGIFPGTYIHGAFGATIMDRPTFSYDNSMVP